MIEISDLIHVADAYKVAACIDRDSTVAYRVFGDTKKLTALRGGAQLTVSRFNDALLWFAENWPEGQEVPRTLNALVELQQRRTEHLPDNEGQNSSSEFSSCRQHKPEQADGQGNEVSNV